MMKLLLAIGTVLIGTTSANYCPDGPEYAIGKIKFICDDAEGPRPIACLPNGKLGDNELAPGQTYSTSAFRFKCTAEGPLGLLSYDVIGCVLPNGSPLEIGGEDGIPNKGLYQCVKNADGTVTRKMRQGCWFERKYYVKGQSWKFDDKEKNVSYQIMCVGGTGMFEAKAAGCFVGEELLQVGSFTKQGNEFFECVADEKFKHRATLVKVDGTFGGVEAKKCRIETRCYKDGKCTKLGKKIHACISSDGEETDLNAHECYV